MSCVKKNNSTDLHVIVHYLHTPRMKALVRSMRHDAMPSNDCLDTVVAMGLGHLYPASIGTACRVTLTTYKLTTKDEDDSGPYSRREHATRVFESTMRSDGSTAADIVTYMDRVKKRISGRAIDLFLGRSLSLVNYTYCTVTGVEGKAPELCGDETDVADGSTIREIDLNESYRSNLKNLSKCCFDLFARGRPLHVDMGNGVVRQTTLCQLMFFQWSRSNCAIEFIETVLAAANGNSQIKSALVRASTRAHSPEKYRLNDCRD